MNENCKYCKISKTCLENADYGSIYCQLHKRIPKVIGKTYDELQQENQKLKQQLQQRDNIINKAKEIIDKFYVSNNFVVYDNNDITKAIIKLEEILDNKGE